MRPTRFKPCAGCALARGGAAIAASFLVAAIFAAGLEPGFSRSVTPGLVRHYAALFGPRVPAHLNGWQELVRRAQAQPVSDRDTPVEAALLAPVNRFFNRVVYATDRDLWHADDYWATPAEMLAADGADCEDYAIAKYFTLKELGVPVSKLRLVYARTWLAANEAHMVLAFYDTPGADPLILDNLQAGIDRATDRPDLVPVYTFNDEDVLLLRQDAPALTVSPSSNRKWQGLVDKLRRELTY
jgi:predicted transglutaminase-like cysteine proteinase